MSLIEKALGKSRSSAEKGAASRKSASSDAHQDGRREGDRAEASDGAKAAVDRPLREPAARVAKTPQLVISPQLLREMGPMLDGTVQQQKMAEYRHIKRRLIAEMQTDGNSRLLLIASALSGEGKSFSSFNLALSLALEPDFAVLLVDADVIKPNLSRRLGQVDRPGLLDAAIDPNVDVESLIQTTSVEGLSFLPAGHGHDNATEHFASARMQEIMQRLLDVPNRIVIVDSLPLLMTTEARALAPLAGQVVLVVRAESTPQSAVMQALELLGEDVNVKLLLNAVVRTKFNRYYGYGYGYDYNYGVRERGAGKGEA